MPTPKTAEWIPVSLPPVSVLLGGDIPAPDTHPIQSTADAIWSYIATRFGLTPSLAPPQIYFQGFDRAMQSPEWTAWQKQWTRLHPDIWRDWIRLTAGGAETEVTDEWIGAHIDQVFPFPSTFLAFHYDGTNRIQMNPERTFGPDNYLDPAGIRRNLAAYGYYTMAHEMLHYALEARGIVPTRLHHCLYLRVRPGSNDRPIVEELADHLVERGFIPAYVRQMGLRNERYFNPCAALSPSDIKQVEGMLEDLRRATP